MTPNFLEISKFDLYCKKMRNGESKPKKEKIGKYPNFDFSFKD